MAFNTVQAVFDLAIRWMDAQNETSGATLTADTREYALRTPDILNGFLNIVYPASDTYAPRADGQRPCLPPVSAMTDTMDLDAFVCMSVLPFALAAGLLTAEDPVSAAAARELYQQNLALARLQRCAAVESVEDVYGGVEHGQFAAWS